ncbi:MAG: hypothetical protein HFK04_01180 [Oscillospiraceae bacterium]|nr:hypothetical protein [Oscillospiraceae bacterium]
MCQAEDCNETSTPEEHTFQDGICTVCGDKKDPTGGGQDNKPGSGVEDEEDVPTKTPGGLQDPTNNPTIGDDQDNDSEAGVDLKKDITDSNLVAAIQEQIKKKENSFIAVYYDNSSNPTLVSDIFAAIQGKKEAYVVAGDGERLKWVFKGEYIKNPKDVHLKVDISPLKSTNSANKSKISRLVGNTPTCVLSFAHNGELPGKTRIRVDMDSVFPGTTKKYFWVYHFTGNDLDCIAENVSVDNKGILDFWITHNSDYIITDRAIPETKSNNKDSANDGIRLSEVSNSNSSGTGGKSNPHTGGY